jgi:hypothetical protein
MKPRDLCLGTFRQVGGGEAEICCEEGRQLEVGSCFPKFQRGGTAMCTLCSSRDIQLKTVAWRYLGM